MKVREVFLAGVAALAIAGCANKGGEKCEPEPLKTESGWLRFDSSLSPITIQYPPGWYLSAEAQLLGHDVFIKDRNFEEIYAPQIDIWTEVVKDETSLDQATQNILQSIRDDQLINGVDPSDINFTVSAGPCIDGSPSRIISNTDKARGLESIEYVVQKNDILLQLAFSASPASFADNKPAFEQMTRTVKFDRQSQPLF